MSTLVEHLAFLETVAPYVSLIRVLQVNSSGPVGFIWQCYGWDGEDRSDVDGETVTDTFYGEGDTAMDAVDAAVADVAASAPLGGPVGLVGGV